MRKTLKLSLTLVLALAMLFAVAVIASAETEPTASGDWSRNDSDSVTWEYFADTQTLVISGKGGMKDVETGAMRPWHSYASSIQNVVIEEGITRICKFAFLGFTKVTEVTIPDSVTYIGSYAFQNMSKMQTLNVGTGITTIANNAFTKFGTSCQVNIKDLSAWCKINFAGGTSNPVSAGNKKLALNGEIIKDLVIPADVTAIGKYAFRQNRALLSLVLHDGITSIGNQAFDGCNKMTKVTLDNCVINFGNFVFRYCSTLVNTYVNNLATWTQCKIPTANSSPLGSGANRNCLYVNGKKYAKSYSSNGREYDTDAAAVLVIPDGATTIKANTFRQRSRNLTTVYIPESVTTIEGTSKNNGPFAYSTSVKYIYGVEGSAAETFAKAVGYTFVATTFEKVTAITVDTDDTTLNIGESLTAKATVAPATVTTAPMWKSSDLAVARVSNGVVTAIGAGQATITVSTMDGTVSDSFVVTVPAIAVTGITLDTAEATVKMGHTIKLVATVTPADATNAKVTWTSSNKAIATVKNGVVTPVAGGQVTITAKVGTFTATCLVTVDAPVIEVTGITLDTTAAVLKPADTLKLVATVTPADATDATVTWTSSNNAVATVVDGVVTAVAEGDAVITAKAGNFEATCTIKVEIPVIEVTGITLDVTAAVLNPEDTLQLTATVTPADATDATVTWTSSNDAVATVVDGLVTAVAEGDAVITAKAGNFEATCTIKVEIPVIEVTGITLDVAAAVLEPAETLQLNATVTPADATDPTVTWTSSNDAVATVVDGLVTAIADGDAVITAKAGNFEATCTIKVETPEPEYLPVEEIFLDVEDIELTIGDEYTFEVIFNPEEATDKSLYWESSNEDVATIDENGKLVALTEGFTIITVISLDNEDAYAECFVNVAPAVAATGVTLNKTSASVLVGDTVELVATVTPAEAANKNVSWTTSNDAVATVVDGVVTATGAGVATITVTTEDGEFTATCKVVVSAGNELPALPWNN